MTSYVRFVAGQLNLCTYNGVFKYFFLLSMPTEWSEVIAAGTVCLCVLALSRSYVFFVRNSKTVGARITKVGAHAGLEAP